MRILRLLDDIYSNIIYNHEPKYQYETITKYLIDHCPNATDLSNESKEVINNMLKIVDSTPLNELGGSVDSFIVESMLLSHLKQIEMEKTDNENEWGKK